MIASGSCTHDEPRGRCDLSKPERPIQITTNGSFDDHPSWDPTGNAIYFRSNRGGEWAIWKIVSR